MYGLRSKLVSLPAQACVLSKPKDTSLQQNMTIFRKLRIRNVL
jgi:hypothetical protein